MERWITDNDQSTGSIQVSLTAGNNEIVMPARSGALRRTQFTVTNVTVGASMHLNKGNQPASATVGLPMSTNQTYIEGDDGGYTCFQGAIQVYSDINATVQVTEMLESRYQ